MYENVTSFEKWVRGHPVNETLGGELAIITLWFDVFTLTRCFFLFFVKFFMVDNKWVAAGRDSATGLGAMCFSWCVTRLRLARNLSPGVQLAKVATKHYGSCRQVSPYRCTSLYVWEWKRCGGVVVVVRARVPGTTFLFVSLVASSVALGAPSLSRAIHRRAATAPARRHRRWCVPKYSSSRFHFFFLASLGIRGCRGYGRIIEPKRKILDR